MMGAETIWDAIVVGAGPAGSLFAGRAAAASARILVLDHSHPRFKPCSGFLTETIFSDFEELGDFTDCSAFNGDRRYIAPSGIGFKVPSDSAITRFRLSSRLEFDLHLLEKAKAKGAVCEKQKVLFIGREKGYWKVRTDAQRHFGRVLVGADGARSMVRRSTIGPIPKYDFLIGVGFRKMGGETSELVTRSFRGGKVGFVLPGYGFSQVALATRMEGAKGLRSALREFAKQRQFDISGCEPWVGVQPAPISPWFFDEPCCGDDFCLIGDAAGHCDALNAEGIPFALRGASLAAEAFLEGSVKGFDDRWRDIYGKRLAQNSKKATDTPSAFVQNFAAKLMSKSPTLVRQVSRGLANGASKTKALRYSLQKIHKIFPELIKGKS